MAYVSSRLDRKLLGDTAWNYSAFALMAGTGIILNFFIAIVSQSYESIMDRQIEAIIESNVELNQECL